LETTTIHSLMAVIRNRLAGAGGGTPLRQLKITLRFSNPPIWRRVVVRADMTLDRLHHVIQTSMGWTNSHLHQFRLGRVYYGILDGEFDGFGIEMLNEKQYTVADLAPVAKKKFIYEYDFGDSWEHEILVEKVLSPDPAIKHPVCLAGANACPPEDCGGIPGYYQLLAALADPKHEQHHEMKEWVGGEWDASLFDLEATNACLKRLKA
jgi:pRiA4b ORF-3-like protein